MEQQQLKKCPIGIQTFEEIINKGYLYIDKTEYVYRMAYGASKYCFLSRPRRFGKSLLTSTLHSYFAGKKDLFRGLAIEKLETEWTEYPVLHFDMSLAKHVDKDTLESMLSFQLSGYEQIYGKPEEAVKLNDRMTSLIMRANEQTGRQVVVLIDEYDAPLLDVMHEETDLPVLRNVMRNFYSPLKACDPYLRFVFLTGITKFSQLSIFSELNNILNISMLKPYAAICGITQEEMQEQMTAYIEWLAVSQEMSKEETLQKLKEKYDGYHFTWPSPDIYNPFSLLNALERKKIDNYWFGSGTPTYLVEMLRKFHVLPSEVGHSMQAMASDFDAPTEKMESIVPLLYQSGYLTIKGYDEEFGMYRLGFPNREVEEGFVRFLLPFYANVNKVESPFEIQKFVREVRSGDYDSFFLRLQSFFADTTYEAIREQELHYENVLFIVFKLIGFYTQVKYHTSKGRIDLVLQTDKFIYVIEFKLDGTAEEALQQIHDKHYALPFASDGRKLFKIGVNFSAETRNIEKWIVEE